MTTFCNILTIFPDFRKFTPYIFIILSIVLSPFTLFAQTTHTVGTGEDHFETIQEAIDEAKSGDTIVIKPRSEAYVEKITLKAGLILRGEETARTIIKGDGSEPVITASDDVTIKNLSITGGTIGILADNNSSVTISNNLILNNDTGISCFGSDKVKIEQNTLDNNEVDGISCSDAQTLTINKNIIRNSETGIVADNITTLTHTGNGFSANTDNGAEGDDFVTENPALFASPSQNDYHLKSGSLFLGDNTTDQGDDIGAYGGSGSDRIPFEISGLATIVTADSITVSWNKNLAYNIVGYRIYFDKSAGERTNRKENTDCTTPPCSTDLTGLDNAVGTLEAPNFLNPISGDQQLFLDWEAPSEQSMITAYQLHSGTRARNTDEDEYDQNVTLGNISSHTLSGLTNDTPYFLALKSVAQARYFISVTAYVDVSEDTTPNESSVFQDQETALDVAPVISVFSNEVQGLPEMALAFPNLPDEGGCFIATAAFGSILAPHVQILRTFRDRYLLPTRLGSAFVKNYYQYGPAYAEVIRQDERLRFVVRVVLLPLIALSYFLIQTTLLQKGLSILFVFMAIVFIFRLRKNMPRNQGT